MMGSMTARQRVIDAAPPEVCVLDEAKARRLGAKTMLMPSPAQLEAMIAEIPAGSTKTLKGLRQDLARTAGADMTCPVAARNCWRMVAEAVEEERGSGIAALSPWWRITADGKPGARLPGGPGHQVALLAAEGIALSA